MGLWGLWGYGLSNNKKMIGLPCFIRNGNKKREDKIYLPVFIIVIDPVSSTG